MLIDGYAAGDAGPFTSWQRRSSPKPRLQHLTTYRCSVVQAPGTGTTCSFIVNAPSNQIFPNRRAVLDWFRKGMTTRSSYERSIEQVRVDGDIVILMGAETLTPIGKAPQAGQTVRRRFTNIWKKEGDTWRLWARHANLILAPAAAKPN